MKYCATCSHSGQPRRRKPCASCYFIKDEHGVRTKPHWHAKTGRIKHESESLEVVLRPIATEPLNLEDVPWVVKC